ncbi:MAG TPA: GNAT family N-acetyltransferase [Bacteroidia bacterium]|nr:GNAT family N-acetyltransferase [Bacteroidia bacterium]
MDRELSTDQLRIINCDLQTIEMVLRGNDVLTLYLGVEVPADWTEFGAPIFQYTLDRLQKHPGDAVWWSWLPVLRAENLLVGSCGFKGKPNAAGEVEMGYEIAASRRQMGLGTEAALALRDFAFGFPEVKKVIAHTLADHNPSTRILGHCGMVKVAELVDPEDGPVWRWEIDRETYEKAGQ